MTEPLGVSPSQTVGPYGSIGLFRELITPRARRPGGSACVPPLRHADRRRRRAGARRDDRDLAGERGRPLRAPRRRPLRARARERVPRLRPLGHAGRALRVRHDQARAGALAGRRDAGAAHRGRRVRARPAQADRDARLLPRRGGRERRRPGALVGSTQRRARRSSPWPRATASASTSGSRGRVTRRSSLFEPPHSGGRALERPAAAEEARCGGSPPRRRRGRRASPARPRRRRGRSARAPVRPACVSSIRMMRPWPGSARRRT